MSSNTDDEESILRNCDSNSNWKCCCRKKDPESHGRDNIERGDDDDVLLDNNGCGLWERLKRVQWFWAELVLFLYLFCEFPLSFVNQKYILEWITMYNWNQDLLNNISHNFNITSGDSIITCHANKSSPEFAFNQHNQMMTSYYGMLRMGVWVFPAMFSTIVLGSVSDKHGRKWVFIPPALGNFITTFSVIFVVHFKASILWILILDFANGLSGSIGTIILAGVAHVVGKTTVQNRMFRITIVQISLMAGSTLSPFTMGPAYAHLGPTMTLIITATVSGTNLLYAVVNIPAMKNSNSPGLVVDADHHSKHKDYSADETLNRSIQSENSPIVGNDETAEESGLTHRRVLNDDQTPEIPQGLSGSSGTSSGPSLFRQMSKHIRNTYRIYSFRGSRKNKHGSNNHQGENSESSNLTSSLLSTFSDIVSSLDLSSDFHKSNVEAVGRLRVLICALSITVTAYFDIIVMTLFELNTPLCWDSSMIGLYTGVLLSVTAVGSLFLAPIMEKYSNHVTIAIICCITSCSYRVYLFFVRDTYFMFYGVILNIFNMLLLPSIRTMMTLLVEPGRHGAVLGSIAAVENLCCFTGSIIFNIVYSATLFYSTATVFLVSASLYGVGALIFLGYRIRYGTGSVIVIGQVQEVLA